MPLGRALAGLLATMHAAHAAGSCNGTYSAAALQPLPQPAIVRLDVADDSPRNLELARALTSGLQQGGLQVAGMPTLQLSVTYTLSNPGGAGYDQWGAQSNWDGMNGGITLERPDMPQFGAAPPPGPSTLYLRADLRDMRTSASLWVAAIQCQLQGSPDTALAFDVGLLVGQSAGKRVDRAPF